MTLSGNIATRKNDPETFRQAGFEVNHYRDLVTLTLSDPETGTFLGAVHLEVKGERAPRQALQSRRRTRRRLNPCSTPGTTW